jgi:hypothetical protein
MFFLLFVILNKYSISSCVENYNLKWLSNDTLFPVIFTQEIANPDSYIWYKHYEKSNVGGLYRPDYYQVEVNDGQNVLKLLNYNFTTQDQLDHYILRRKRKPSRDEDDSFIFTIGYLNDFYMTVHEEKNRINVNCTAKVAIPLGINDYHKYDLSLDIENIDLNFDFVDPNGRVRRRRKRRSTFERFLMNIQVEAVPITIFRSSKHDFSESLFCKLILKSYDGTMISKTIYKTFGNVNPTTNAIGTQLRNSIRKPSPMNVALGCRFKRVTVAGFLVILKLIFNFV